MRRAILIAATAIAIAVAGCGGARHGAQPPPQPLAARAQGGGGSPLARPADYRAPIRRYRAYVGRQLVRMELAAAHRDWLRVSVLHGTIGAAYGAFGVRDERLQQALDAARRSPAGARPVRRALADLRAALPRMRIDPLEYSLRVHEILEDALHLELGARRPAASTYAIVAANVTGTRFVLGTVRALVDRRSRPARQAAEAGLDRLDRALRALRRRDGSYPAPAAATLRDRERIAAFTADAAERLSQLPELLDPRTPPPARSPFGTAP